MWSPPSIRRPPVCPRRPRRQGGGTLRRHYDGRYLDKERTLKLIPDITWWQGGQCAGVLDAKYKRVADKRFPNGDAYQMLAYATGLGLSRGTLVYARSEGESHRSHCIRNASKVIAVRALDVEAEPGELLTQVDKLAGEVAALEATSGSEGVAGPVRASAIR